MHPELQALLDEALQIYTKGEYYQILLLAKEEYFRLSGRIDDEDDDYEVRMRSFNDWYILQFIPDGWTMTIMKDYLIKKQVEDRVSKALLNSIHSLYEYLGESFSGKFVVYDLIHDCKFHFSTREEIPHILKNDLFVGRIIEFDNKNYLMDGMCAIPKEIKTILKKQGKFLRKQDDQLLERDFLMKLEYFKTKWKRYGHIEPKKIFVFEEANS